MGKSRAPPLSSASSSYPGESAPAKSWEGVGGNRPRNRGRANSDLISDLAELVSTEIERTYDYRELSAILIRVKHCN